MNDMKKVYDDLIIINLYIYYIYGPGRRFEGHMHNNPINSWDLYQICQVHDRKAILLQLKQMVETPYTMIKTCCVSTKGPWLG